MSDSEVLSQISKQSSSRSTVLAPQQIVCLSAVLDRIIPPDSESAGGSTGGALTYILRHLEEGGNLAPFRSVYPVFLDALEADGFAALLPADQDKMLGGQERSPDPAARRFFRSLAEHAQEGYYTSPANWSGVGFEVTG
ncbi:MAG: gluconate 2-dehydrogenase subunit 3 family protein [Cytophagales bacterium]|nr:gluconate 2-dehydrogenase subunit 3 family protein [Armatimonadota bacterium]